MNRVHSVIPFILAIIFATPTAATTVRMAVPAGYEQNVFAREIITSKSLKEADLQIGVVNNLDAEATLSAILSGAVDVGLTTLDAIINHKFENQPILASIFTHPFLFQSTQDLLDIQNSALGEAVLVDISRTRLIPLAYWNAGNESLITKKQISTPNDLAALNIVTVRPNVSSIMLSKLGASQMVLPAGAYSSAAFIAGDANATIAQEIPPDLSMQFDTLYITQLRPIVGVLLANGDHWRNLTERQRIEWRSAINIATKYSAAAALQESAKNRAYRNFKLIDFAAEQQTELLRKLFPNNPDIANQAILVRNALDQIRSQRQKKKTETRRPLVYPKPSTVIYVTDRNDEGGADLLSRFGIKHELSWSPNCGSLKIGIDLSRNFGEPYNGIISPIHPSTTGFEKCLELISSQIDSDRVLIFIHGFNNSFEAAIKRAAGMAFDYYFKGPIVVWAWPSDGRSLSYPFDEDSSRWTAPHFAEFLRYLHRRLPRIHLNLFAHSMGNRILLAALYETRDARLRVDTLIFAAPDEAPSIFEQALSKINKAGSLLTLYGSENDRALALSRWFHSPHGHRIPRAGDGGTSILIADGLESVDTSDLPTEGDGHRYVFENLRTVDDIKSIISHRQTASERGLPERFRQNRKYWTIAP